MRIKAAAVSVALWSCGSLCLAAEWINDVEVVRVGTYQHSPGHFVWLSSGVVGECQAAIPSNPTLSFSGDKPGGKALFATLTAAVIAKRKVDVQVAGCDIVEVYLK